MGKDSHFTRQPVYSQVLKLLDKEKIRQINYERYVEKNNYIKFVRFVRFVVKKE